MSRFRNTGALVDLADGSIAAPGADVSLTKEEQTDPHNAALIESGRLAPTGTTKATKEEVTGVEAGS
jgi:hypothetical protein